ncbi:hypothetical protein G6F43_014038 [Rhizopus delemar]|nr:hypothetical protein G6F43_014038 [Rhizopus delemar]
MRAGFHQVPMEENSKELTAFTTKFGTYHYNTLPMGLVNSPATFQRLIDLCFRPLINKCLVAYIDDLNVYSLDHHTHLYHLEQRIPRARFLLSTLHQEFCCNCKASTRSNKNNEKSTLDNTYIVKTRLQ